MISWKPSCYKRGVGTFRLTQPELDEAVSTGKWPSFDRPPDVPAIENDPGDLEVLGVFPDGRLKLRRWCRVVDPR